MAQYPYGVENQKAPIPTQSVQQPPKPTTRIQPFSQAIGGYDSFRDVSVKPTVPTKPTIVQEPSKPTTSIKAFQEQADYPFGRANQKVPVSSLPKPEIYHVSAEQLKKIQTGKLKVPEARGTRIYVPEKTEKRNAWDKFWVEGLGYPADEGERTQLQIMALSSTPIGKGASLGWGGVKAAIKNPKLGYFGIQAAGFGRNLLVGAVSGELATKSIMQTGDILENDAGVRAAQNAQYQAESKIIGTKGGKVVQSVKSSLYQIGGVDYLISKGEARDEGLKAAEETLKSQGYSGAELTKRLDYVKKDRLRHSMAELGGLMAAGIAGEAGGQTAIASSYAKREFKGELLKAATKSQKVGIFFKEGGKAAILTAPAGFTEGAVQERTKQLARQQKTDFKEIIKQGGWGGLSSGAFNVPISGGQIVAKPISKGAAIAGNVLDVSEWFTDKAFDVGNRALETRFARAWTRQPVIKTVAKNVYSFGTQAPEPFFRKTKVITPSFSFGATTKQKGSIAEQLNLGVSSGGSQSLNKAGANFQFGYNPISDTSQDIFGSTRGRGRTPTINIAESISKAMSKTKEEGISRVPVDSKTTDKTFADSISKINNNVNNYINNPSYDITESQTSTNIFTATPTQSRALTMVPVWRISPPMPLLFPAGDFGTGSKRGRGKKYINELEIGKQVLNEMLGGNILNSPKLDKMFRSKNAKKKR
jgi:hypothetical protein